MSQCFIPSFEISLLKVNTYMFMKLEEAACLKLRPSAPQCLQLPLKAPQQNKLPH